MMAEHTFVTVTDMDIFKLDEPQRTALTALLGISRSTARWCFCTDRYRIKRMRG